MFILVTGLLSYGRLVIFLTQSLRRWILLKEFLIFQRYIILFEVLYEILKIWQIIVMKVQANTFYFNKFSTNLVTICCVEQNKVLGIVFAASKFINYKRIISAFSLLVLFFFFKRFFYTLFILFHKFWMIHNILHIIVNISNIFINKLIKCLILFSSHYINFVQRFFLSIIEFLQLKIYIDLICEFPGKI